MDFGLFPTNTSHDGAPAVLLLGQSAIQEAEIVLYQLHVLLDLSKGEVEARQILLDGLRVLLREREHELLLLDIRPDIVVDLAVLAPRLEALVVVNLEEMVAHLIVRENLRLAAPSISHHCVVPRRQRRVHPVPVVVVPLHHLVRDLLLQPALRGTKESVCTSGRSVEGWSKWCSWSTMRTLKPCRWRYVAIMSICW